MRRVGPNNRLVSHSLQLRVNLFTKLAFLLQLIEQLERLDVSEVKVFSDVVTKRRSDIANALASSCLTENRLTDFDWQVKLVMSSDKVSNIQEPVVAVNLALQSSDGSSRNRTIEMSKEGLQKLLTSIEAANKVQ